MRILLVDDDAQLLRALRITLGTRGYEVLTAGDGATALNLAAEHHPGLVVLDLGMPGLDGLDVLHGLRGWSTAPILVVSGRTGAADTVDALDAGADDYVTKPFAMEELLARIRALTRRLSTRETDSLVGLGAHIVDLTAKAVTRRTTGSSVPVRLTPTEWKVLELLVRNPGRLVTRQTLLHEIWGPSHSTDTGYLRLYIAQLRRKLEPEPARPRFLLTESGMGYRFVPGETPPPG